MHRIEHPTRRRFVQGMAVAGGAFALGGELSTAEAAPSDFGGLPLLSGRTFDLDLSPRIVNKTGAENLGSAINGTVPGPILRWREGDVVELNVTNHLSEVTGLHWHGIILPNGMDGVPGLEFAGIQPGETFTYRFPVMQSGTYWYHSHMGYQEQKGLYGALIIEPAGKPLVQADRDYVVVLSDWTDDDPEVIASNFKQMGDYYNFKRRTAETFLLDAKNDGLEATIKERLMWSRMRMDPTGVEAPTGVTYTYLMNGFPPAANWTALFRPHERIRLRFINTSAVSYYDIRIPGLVMSVVNVHGNDVVPVKVDELRIGVAETYDVVVQPKAAEPYTIFAQSMGRTGYARGTLAPRPGMEAAIPNYDPRPMRSTGDMGMMMHEDEIGASNPDHTRIGGLVGEHALDYTTKDRLVGHARKSPPPKGTDLGQFDVEQQMVPKKYTDRLNLPGDGLNVLERRSLTLADLRSVRPGLDDRPPSREIVLRLTGNMERFIWGFDGKKYTEAEPMDVTVGERFRLRMINETMMSHPIHLHGMWMELENGHGRHRPYLHTINVEPAENISLLVTPLATGQWPLHCHILYHFEAGMFRTLRVLPREA